MMGSDGAGSVAVRSRALEEFPLLRLHDMMLLMPWMFNLGEQ